MTTPIALDPQGKFEEGLAIVELSIQNFAALGFDVQKAQDQFDEGQALAAEGQYVKAVEKFSQAMRVLIVSATMHHWEEECLGLEKVITLFGPVKADSLRKRMDQRRRWIPGGGGARRGGIERRDFPCGKRGEPTWRPFLLLI